MYKPCILIPAYNHVEGLKKVLEKVAKRDLSVIVVDDGSDDGTDSLLQEELKKDYPLSVLTNEENMGKGAALIRGFHHALDEGFTHAVTIDADDQHDINDFDTFLGLSKESPNKLILGEPEFDTCAPLERTLGHKFCWFWMCLASLDFSIGDGLCGYRVYPLLEMKGILTKQIKADRMDFDVKILIMMIREGIEFVNVPTKVVYPADGISHFRYFWDNVDIVAVHVYLILGIFPFLVRKLCGKKPYEQLGRNT